MEQLIVDRALEQVRTGLEEGDLDGAISIIRALRPADQAEVFGDLPPAEQEGLLPQLEVGTSADILEKLVEEEAADLASRMDSEMLVTILDEMEPDEAADLLGDLLPERSSQALSQMSAPDEVLPLLLHPDRTAGGLMTSEFMALRQQMTAAEALRAVQQWAPPGETAHYLFVVDGEGHLRGVVSLIGLLKADPAAPVASLMDPEVIHVTAEADQEEAARLMSRYDIVALPVVDGTGRILGAITVDDLVEVMEEEATEDIQRLGGSEPLTKPYLDTNPLVVARKRIGWLCLLFVTATFTGSVMRHFQSELDAVVALAFFVPLIIGTGGNTGSQTTASIVRAVALGEIVPRDALRVFWREGMVGMLLGLSMATFAFIRALTWGAGEWMALSVAISVFGIVLWANSLGSLLPLVATKLRIDPAVISGPVMSTLVDATGLFIYFTIAKVILGI
jgi:magnesium transporter